MSISRLCRSSDWCAAKSGGPSNRSAPSGFQTRASTAGGSGASRMSIASPVCGMLTRCPSRTMPGYCWWTRWRRSTGCTGSIPSYRPGRSTRTGLLPLPCGTGDYRRLSIRWDVLVISPHRRHPRREWWPYSRWDCASGAAFDVSKVILGSAVRCGNPAATAAAFRKCAKLPDTAMEPDSGADHADIGDRRGPWSRCFRDERDAGIGEDGAHEPLRTDSDSHPSLWRWRTGECGGRRRKYLDYQHLTAIAGKLWVYSRASTGP